MMKHTYFFDLNIEKLDVDVKHDRAQERFYFKAHGQEGVLQYKRVDNNILEFQKTYLDREIRGRGWSKELVKQALDYVKDHQVRVKPTCPLVKDYIRAHPEYQSVKV